MGGFDKVFWRLVFWRLSWTIFVSTSVGLGLSEEQEQLCTKGAISRTLEASRRGGLLLSMLHVDVPRS